MIVSVLPCIAAWVAGRGAVSHGDRGPTRWIRLGLSYPRGLTEVISPTLVESTVFEVGEDECGFDYVADLAGAGGGVAEGAPVAGEDSESALAEAAQSAEEGVVGAVVHVEDLVTSGLFVRDVDADPRALVAIVGHCRPVPGGRGETRPSTGRRGRGCGPR